MHVKYGACVIPEHQGKGVGSRILDLIKERSSGAKPIRLGALKGSRSNDFYKAHGFFLSVKKSTTTTMNFVATANQLSKGGSVSVFL